ncbi:MAG TPA: hypothetical protein VLB82_05235 [Thermodesulfobacteriota bacterium]|nr:hypothetical protein [Thermodesulfobacteriota bacterium]
MIVQGSLNYTTSGRKKKKLPKSRRKNVEFRELRSNDRRSAARDRKSYPSHLPQSDSTNKVCHPTLHDYTVAIPYNKGAYQVVPKSDIKYIGK